MVLESIAAGRVTRTELMKIEGCARGECLVGINEIVVHNGVVTSAVRLIVTVDGLPLGHEIVGAIREVGEAVEGWSPGERVAVEPLLWCRPRGFTDLCRHCAAGRVNICERTTDGAVAPGQIIGACRE